MSAPAPQTTLLDSMAKVKDARRPLEAGEQLKYSDGLCLAPFEGKGYHLWISSPNMEFVPEVPTHKWGEVLSYHADGMLGAFELFKWPQMYDELEPHGCAAPGNPMLLANTRWNTRPVVDEHAVLPPFGSEAQVVWTPFDGPCFEAIASTPTAEVGFIAAPFLARLKSAADFARQQAIPLVRRLYAHEDATDAKDQRSRERRRYFMWQIVLRLQRALSHLTEVPMSSFEVSLWTREAQRLLLELQSWVTYHAVIKPRIDDALFQGSTRILPLRGVITSNPGIVDTMFRVGVPVWWVRPATSLSSAMRVVHVREWVQSGICFSRDKDMIDPAGRSMPAPAWIEGSTLDNSMCSLADHIRRFSISSRPTMGAIVSVLPDDREDGARAVSGGAKMRAPTGHGRDEEPPKKKLRMSKPAQGASSSPSSGAPALDRPPWLPAIQEPWQDVLHPIHDMANNNPPEAILYAFPPPSLFYVSGDVLAKRVHNWIRVRKWWLGQALNSLNDRAILMTANHWRIALEGHYFQINFDPHGTDVRPGSSADDIAKLPPPPIEKGARENGGDRAGRKGSTRGRPDRRSLRKTAKQLDVSVHFGVRGGFAPYHEDQSVCWQARSITFTDICVDPPSYAKIITWELSVLNFRVDLFLADREKLHGLYQCKDNLRIAQREDALRAVWDRNGSMMPHWESNNVMDELADKRSGPVAFARLARVVAEWPGASQLLPDARLAARIVEGKESSDTVHKFIVQVGLVYCRLFHDIFGRLPMMPLQIPEVLRKGTGFE